MLEFYLRETRMVDGRDIYTYETQGVYARASDMKAIILVGGRLDKWMVAGDGLVPSKGFLESGYKQVSDGLKRLRTGKGMPAALFAENNLAVLLAKLGELCDREINFRSFALGISSPFEGPAVGIWRWADKKADRT